MAWVGALSGMQEMEDRRFRGDAQKMGVLSQMMQMQDAQEKRRLAGEDRGRADALRGVLAQHGGDLEKTLGALLASGDIANAAKLAPLVESQRKLKIPQPGQSIGSGGLRLPDGTIIPPGARPEGAEKAPDKVRQYQFAQSPAGGSFQGSFERFVSLNPMITAAAQAPLRAAQTQSIVDTNAYNLTPPQQGNSLSDIMRKSAPDSASAYALMQQMDAQGRQGSVSVAPGGGALSQPPAVAPRAPQQAPGALSALVEPTPRPAYEDSNDRAAAGMARVSPALGLSPGQSAPLATGSVIAPQQAPGAPSLPREPTIDDAPKNISQKNREAWLIDQLAIRGRMQVAAAGRNERGQTKYQETLGKESATADLEQYNTAQSGVEAVLKLDMVVKHIKESDVITGIGAGMIKDFNRVKVLLNNDIKAGKKVSDSELLDALLGSDVFPMIKTLGIGARGLDTPKEVAFLRQVMTGDLPMNRETLLQLAVIRRDLTARTIDRWNTRVDRGEVDRFFTETGRRKEKLSVPAAGGAPPAPAADGWNAAKEGRYQELKRKQNGGS